MNTETLIQSIAVGVASAAMATWAQAKVTSWRLRALESRMGKAEEDISHLQQRTARLAARHS